MGISQDEEDLGQDLVFDYSIDYFGRLAAYKLALARLGGKGDVVDALISDVLSHNISENLER